MSTQILTLLFPSGDCCVGDVVVIDQAVTGPPGPPGPTGPPGPAGGSAAAYVHTQASALSTWTIIHNLGYYPNTTVLEGQDQVIGFEIIFDSLIQMRLVFSAAISGVAYLS